MAKEFYEFMLLLGKSVRKTSTSEQKICNKPCQRTAKVVIVGWQIQSHLCSPGCFSWLAWQVVCLVKGPAQALIHGLWWIVPSAALWGWVRESHALTVFPNKTVLLALMVKNDRIKKHQLYIWKHCQRHNGPEGWVHLSKVTYWVISQVQPQILIKLHLQNLNQAITSKSQPNITISTKLEIQNIDQT